MVKDGETFAEEDKKKRAAVDTRNEAEAHIHAARKSLKELDQDLDQGLKNEVETKIKALEEVLKGDDVEMIRTADAALMQAMQQLTSKAYEKAAAGQQAREGAAESGTAEGESAEDDKAKTASSTVDADYEVVDD